MNALSMTALGGVAALALSACAAVRFCAGPRPS